jgi:hypothetical protein
MMLETIVTAPWRSLSAATALILAACLLPGCNQNGDTTRIINNTVSDCGLIRSDLRSTWAVTIEHVTPLTLQDCTGTAPGLSSTAVTSSGGVINFTNVDVFGSDGSTSFRIQADGADAAQPLELDAIVQADSCLALVRVWDFDDTKHFYFQCIGTLDIPSGTISGSCDSAEVDSNGDQSTDTSCSLSASPGMAVSVTP